MVSVIRVAATGEIALKRMSFFAPSCFIVFISPTSESLAAP